MANPVKIVKGAAKAITAGKKKAPAKVQKGIDKTINRIPGNNAKAKLENGKVKIVDKGFNGAVKGSNKAAAKSNVPKRTPGVKKNKSLQRSINNSNRELKK